MDNLNKQNEEEFSDYVKEYINNKSQVNIHKRKKNAKSGTIAIVIFFSLIAIGAIIITVNAFMTKEDSTVTLPAISTFCVSSSDNSSHNINAQFTITGDAVVIDKLGQKKLYEDVFSAVSKMDFSKIPLDNSNQYVKNYVQDYLSSKYKNIRITEIYLTDFSTDKGTQIQKDDDTRDYNDINNNRSHIIDSFSNWNN